MDPALQIMLLLTCSKSTLITLQVRNTQDSDSVENIRKQLFSLQNGRFLHMGGPDL